MVVTGEMNCHGREMVTAAADANGVLPKAQLYTRRPGSHASKKSKKVRRCDTLGIVGKRVDSLLTPAGIAFKYPGAAAGMRYQTRLQPQRTQARMVVGAPAIVVAQPMKLPV